MSERERGTAAPPHRRRAVTCRPAGPHPEPARANTRLIAAYCGLLRLIAAYCGLLRFIAALSGSHPRPAVAASGGMPAARAHTPCVCVRVRVRVCVCVCWRARATRRRRGVPVRCTGLLRIIVAYCGLLRHISAYCGLLRARAGEAKRDAATPRAAGPAHTHTHNTHTWWGGSDRRCRRPALALRRVTVAVSGPCAYCGLLRLIEAYCGLLRLIAAHCGRLRAAPAACCGGLRRHAGGARARTLRVCVRACMCVCARE